MKTVFRFLAMFNFILVMAAVGGIEQNTIGLLAGMALTVLFFGLSVLFAHLGDMFYHK